MGTEFTAATLIGLAGVVFMFGLAVHAAGRTGSHGAGAFAAYSAVAGVRLFADVTLPLLPAPWAAVAGVVSHLTTWYVTILFLLFALRFSARPDGVGRWRTGPFWLAAGLASLFVVTNPIHGWYLRDPWTIRAHDYGPLGLGMIAVTLTLIAVIVVLLARAMIHHEHRRAPLALVMTGVFVNTSASVLPLFAWSPIVYGQEDVVMRAAASLLFAIALFGFGLLRLVPIGREAVLRRMNDGWLVLDPTGRIADLNPAAERLLGVAARWAIGRRASDALRGVAGLEAVGQHGTDGPSIDVRATVGGSERHLDVHVTPLLSGRGALLGRTLLLRDVTALRRAEAQALERERALAALEERERVARELHDGVGQVLGFVRLQAEAAQGLVRRDAATAEAYLDRLAAAALDAHGEVRSFIAGSAAGAGTGWLATIAASARRCSQETGIEVALRTSPGLAEADLAQPVGAHLARIVQEALHNVRKHARASRVTVAVEADGAWVETVVADDGVGVPDPASAGATAGFGLRFMHERAAAAGGSLAVASRPGEGTRVTVRMPRLGAPAVAVGPARETASAGREVG